MEEIEILPRDHSSMDVGRLGTLVLVLVLVLCLAEFTICGVGDSTWARRA
jgi:hypothetical protein